MCAGLPQKTTVGALEDCVLALAHMEGVAEAPAPAHGRPQRERHPIIGRAGALADTAELVLDASPE